MDLLDLAKEIGLKIHKTSVSYGGEYHCECPSCGGRDRFMFWPQKERYWCRQCNSKGDPIQFCREFIGMGYKDACMKVGEIPKTSFKTTSEEGFSPLEAAPSSQEWIKEATGFVAYCHRHVFKIPSCIQQLIERGFDEETIKHFHLGWHPSNLLLPLSAWGLPTLYKEDGKERKLWLPRGVVIPTIEKEVIKIKVRRSDWKEGGALPKYVEVLGSMKCPSVWGDISAQVAVIVESELDAMLIWQFARDVCCCIAIGGAGKRPDSKVHKILCSMGVILFALDFDEAGKKAFKFWRATYSNIKAWPVPITKSPGDALKNGLDLRKWILSGLKGKDFT
ncbi:MAG: hypothetical protein JSS09_06360 [Verrucomicrobia bacterium]|nr:hypothetical protein [Verrucomicrobiota bacterium]